MIHVIFYQLGTQYNFRKADPAYVTTQGVPYDIGSIMHYSHNAFTNNGESTIVPVDPNVEPSELGQRDGLSYHDRQHLHALYGDSECNRSNYLLIALQLIISASFIVNEKKN